METTFVPTKWTMAFLLFAAMLTIMGGAAVAPALPLISEVFSNAPEFLISMIITLPALAIACTGYFVGMAGDRFGKRPVLLLSLAIFAVAGSAGFFLDSLPAILASRIVLGVGIAGITTATTALLAEYYTGVSRMKVLGYQSAAMGMGVLVLETCGGALAEISWREPFLIYLIGVVILIGVICSVKEPVRQTRDPRRGGAPKLNMKIMLPIYLTTFFGMAFLFLMPTKLPYLATQMDSTSLAGIGLLLGVMGCCSALTGLFYGRIAVRMHQMQVLFLGFLAMGAGLCLLGFAGSVAAIAFAVVFVGLGNGVIIPAATNWIASETPREVMGKAIGGFSVALNLGQFGSSLVVVPILALVGTNSNLFLVAGVAATLISLVYAGFWMRQRHASETS